MAGIVGVPFFSQVEVQALEGQLPFYYQSLVVVLLLEEEIKLTSTMWQLTVWKLEVMLR